MGWVFPYDFSAKISPKKKYATLGEPLQVSMKTLINENLIKAPTYENYQEPDVKPPWYNEN